MMVEAKRLEAIRVYLSQGSQAKKNKNYHLMRKNGEINYSSQHPNM